MQEERGLVYLSLPFTAGVAAGALCPMSYAAAFATAASLFLMMAICLVRSPRHMAVYAFFMFLCGLFCSLTAGIYSVSQVQGTGLLEGLHHRMSAAAEALPFRYDGTAPLVRALALGDRAGLDAQTREAFRLSGASHILALSGLHLGIFYMGLSYLLAPLGRSRIAKQARSVVIICTTVFYVVLAGASASLFRAMLFVIFREGASMLNRKMSLLRILLCALMVQLMLFPGEIKSAGFQLSYLAVAGIAVLYPRLERLYPKGEGRLDIIRKIWQLCCLSISCQIFTAPVVWFRFGSFPQYFLISNLLAMPVATLLTGTSILIVFLSAIGLCPDFLLSVADFSAELLVKILSIISGM